MKDNFSNKHLVNILIPMAGLGLRFKRAGYNIPKPLIEVQGKTLIEWAMQSFSFLDKIDRYRILFIVLKSDIQEYFLDKRLQDLFPQATILVIDHKTRGQAETCLMASKYIDNFNKLFIYNCDTYSISNIWDIIEEEDPDGILTCFKSRSRKYSYAKVDKLGYVCETAEKKVISPWATSGMYYFKYGKDFVSSVQDIISRKVMSENEYYVAPCFNEMIKKGKKIKALLVERNVVMGTPEELKRILKNSSLPSV